MSLDKGYCHIRVPKMVFRACLDPPFHLPPFYRCTKAPAWGNGVLQRVVARFCVVTRW